MRKAVKWNSPFYGIEGQGWFLSFHTFTNCVKVTLFQGTSLRPVPPRGKVKDARRIHIHEDDLDEAQMATWIVEFLAPWFGMSATASFTQRYSTRVDIIYLRFGGPQVAGAARWTPD